MKMAMKAMAARMGAALAALSLAAALAAGLCSCGEPEIVSADGNETGAGASQTAEAQRSSVKASASADAKADDAAAAKVKEGGGSEGAADEAPEGEAGGEAPGQSGTGAGAAEAPNETEGGAGACSHDWRAVYETHEVTESVWVDDGWQEDLVWVTDEAAWDESITAGVIICGCGAEFSSPDAWMDHQMHDSCGFRNNRVESRVIGTVHHEEVGHWEDQGHEAGHWEQQVTGTEQRISGYVCTLCGQIR